MARKNNRRVNPRKAVHDGFYEDDGQYQGQGNRRARRAAKAKQDQSQQQGSHQSTPVFNFDVKHVKPLTRNQEIAFNLFQRDGKNLVMSGCAGTGKTFCAAYLALKEFLRRDAEYERIIFIRSAVQSREMGFTTGDVREKEEPYKQIYRPIVGDLLQRDDAFQILEKKRCVEFMSTSFLRGLTFDNAIVIFDEIQNCNFTEIQTVISRIGKNSRLIMSGDFRQTDLKKRNDESGFNDFMRVASRMKEFGMVDFQPEDIVRSGFVRAWFEALAKT